jgi:hypothetical protein
MVEYSAVSRAVKTDDNLADLTAYQWAGLTVHHWVVQTAGQKVDQWAGQRDEH